MLSLFDKFPREMGFPKRNGEYRIVKNKEQMYEAINKYNGRQSIYTSVYAFTKTKKNGFNKDFPDYEYPIIDKVFFDLDSKNSFENIQKFHNFLLKENLKHCLIFSGGGFHCYVSCKHSDKLKDKKSIIANIQIKILEAAGLTIGEPEIGDIDEHIIGDIARITRVPNTFNVKRNCFCVPIFHEDFERFKSIEEIKDKAKSQRLIPIKWYGEVEIDTEKYDYTSKKKVNLNIEIPEYTLEDKDFGDENLWPCVKKMLTEHTDHKKRYWGVIFLREMGYSEEEAKRICKKYLEQFQRNDGTKNDFNHMIIHDHTFETVYHKDGHFFPNCEKLYAEGLCQGKCKHYKEMYMEMKQK